MRLSLTRKYLFISLALALIVPLASLSDNKSNSYGYLSGSLVSKIKDLVKPGEASGDYQAQLVGQSHTDIRIQENEEVRIWVDFKNVGHKTWHNDGDREFIALNTDKSQDRESLFRAADWEYKFNTKTYRPGRMSHGIVAPGDVGRFYVNLKAPQKKGDYKENFKLVSEWREWVSGGEVAINITVTSQNKIAFPKKTGDNIKVGIYKPERNTDPISISCDGQFKIFDSKKNLIAIYHKNEIVTVRYQGGKYHLEAPAMRDGVYDPKAWHKEVNSYIKFVPKNKPLQVLNIDNRPSWNIAFNYDRFRGNLIVRYAPKTDNTWVINQLPMEKYLRGIHELSDYHPRQMQKVFAVSQRSFAQEIVNKGGKYKNGHFDVTDTSADQVYEGYNFEMQAPKLVKATTETAGEMVTYDNKVVFTPYFARSDGRTRNSEDVWFQKLPWLRSVKDPCCTNKTMWGHGVGMSAQGVKYFAEKDWDYKKILNYYYKGIKIKDLY